MGSGIAQESIIYSILKFFLWDNNSQNHASFLDE